MSIVGKIVGWIFSWYIKRYFGDRCPEYCFGCISCDCWRVRDILVEEDNLTPEYEVWFAEGNRINDWLWKDYEQNKDKENE